MNDYKFPMGSQLGPSPKLTLMGCPSFCLLKTNILRSKLVNFQFCSVFCEYFYNSADEIAVLEHAQYFMAVA